MLPQMAGLFSKSVKKTLKAFLRMRSWNSYHTTSITFYESKQVKRWELSYKEWKNRFHYLMGGTAKYLWSYLIYHSAHSGHSYLHYSICKICSPLGVLKPVLCHALGICHMGLSNNWNVACANWDILLFKIHSGGAPSQLKQPTSSSFGLRWWSHGLWERALWQAMCLVGSPLEILPLCPSLHLCSLARSLSLSNK